MKTIMIVDDDLAIQDAYGLALEGAGYRVIVYANGHELLRNEFAIPDVLVLDKQLSGADGIDICRWLKAEARTRHLPVIMLSASPHIKVLAMQAGADAFLEKPFRLRELMQLLEEFTAH